MLPLQKEEIDTFASYILGDFADTARSWASERQVALMARRIQALDAALEAAERERDLWRQRAEARLYGEVAVMQGLPDIHKAHDRLAYVTRICWDIPETQNLALEAAQKNGIAGALVMVATNCRIETVEHLETLQRERDALLVWERELYEAWNASVEASEDHITDREELRFVLCEASPVWSRQTALNRECVAAQAEAARLRAALGRLLAAYDAERAVIDVEPSALCVICTSNTTPNKYQKRLCALHEAEKALTRAKEGE